MNIKVYLAKNILLAIPMALVIVILSSCNNSSSNQPSDMPDGLSAEEVAIEGGQEADVVEHDDSPTAADIEREEKAQAIADAGQVINNHFVALAKGDREMLRNTVADVVTSYIGMSNVTPADIEKYMQSLHTNSSQELSYIIRHVIVSKDADGGFYTVSFSLVQIVHQGENNVEHTFAGRSEINREGKITSLMLSQQS